ncbi:MAG: hypothetical protein U1F37_01800 [Alphaproteobacteria bacterium]
MNAKLIGGGLVAVVAVAAGVYFGVLRGGGPGDAAAAKERADKLFAVLKERGGELSYKSAEAPSGGLVLKDVTINQKDPSGKAVAITVGEIRVARYDWDNPKQPAFAEAEYRKLRIPQLTDNPGFKEFASVTGLSDIVINARFSYTYDKANKTIDVKTGDSEFEGLGTLSFTAKAEGVDIDQFNGVAQLDPAKLMGMVGTVRLHGLRLAFKDAGGAAKLVKFGAHKEKKSEAELKAQMLAQLAQAKAAPFKIAREAAAAAESFLGKPGTFAIEARPAAPFAFAQLMGLMGKPDPAAIDKLTADLGLTVKAN